MSKSAAEIEREIRDALTGLPVESRGLWHEMRYLIEQFHTLKGGRLGHLRRNDRPLSASQLAIAAGCPADLVALKLQDLMDVGLIEKADGGGWKAMRLAQLEARRLSGQERTRKWREGKTARRQERRPKRDRAARVSRDTPCDTVGDARVTRTGVTPPPSPPFLSPETPLLYPLTQPQIPGASAPGPTAPHAGRRAGAESDEGADVDELAEQLDADQDEDEDRDDGDSTRMVPIAGARRAASPTADSVKPRRKRPTKPRKTTDEELAKHREFFDWYRDECWPKANHGVQYEPTDGADAAAVWWLLRRKAIDWHVDALKELARVYVAMPVTLTPPAKPLFGMRQKFNTIRTWKAQHEQRSNDTAPRTIQRPGQYAEPAGRLANLSRGEVARPDVTRRTG